MNRATHTPGPWKVRRPKFSTPRIEADIDCFGLGVSCQMLATLHPVRTTNLDDSDDKRMDADAALIAAAPELLTSLKECVAILSNKDVAPIVKIHVESMARAAIAKAEGRV